MGGRLFNEGAFALARLALKSVQGTLVNMNVDPDAERAAVATHIAALFLRGLLRHGGTPHLAAVISAAAARPYLLSVSRRPHQVISVLRGADSIRLDWESGKS